MKNFLTSGPPWVSNLLAILLALLVLLQAIGEQLIAFFNTINCEPCLAITNTTLGVVAFVLSLMKAFSKPSESQSGKIDSTLLVVSFLLFNVGQSFANTISTQPSKSKQAIILLKKIPSCPK